MPGRRYLRSRVDGQVCDQDQGKRGEGLSPGERGVSLWLGVRDLTALSGGQLGL